MPLALAGPAQAATENIAILALQNPHPRPAGRERAGRVSRGKLPRIATPQAPRAQQEQKPQRPSLAPITSNRNDAKACFDLHYPTDPQAHRRRWQLIPSANPTDLERHRSLQKSQRFLPAGKLAANLPKFSFAFNGPRREGKKSHYRLSIQPQPHSFSPGVWLGTGLHRHVLAGLPRWPWWRRAALPPR